MVYTFIVSVGVVTHNLSMQYFEEKSTKLIATAIWFFYWSLISYITASLYVTKDSELNYMLYEGSRYRAAVVERIRRLLAAAGLSDDESKGWVEQIPPPPPPSPRESDNLDSGSAAGGHHRGLGAAAGGAGAAIAPGTPDRPGGLSDAP